MILIFDVNATLLDLSPLGPHFKKFFGTSQVMGEWFGQMLRHSLVATITRTYQPFDVLGKDALRMTAARKGVALTSENVDTITAQMRALPPHSDVVPALTRLKDAGVRMATLTNSPPPVLAAQLEFARLTDFFERQITVDTVKLFKPAPEPYLHAAQEFGVPIGEIRLVAAHNWDVTGAIRAGAKAAFVARPGMVLGENDEIPDIIGPDLGSVADQLLNMA
jgi:2-haloacid dehalogenase